MKTYSGSGSAILVDVIAAAVIGALSALVGGIGTGMIAGIVVFLLFLAMSIRIVNEWNRMPVLRLGRYQGIIGPGFITILPIVESTPYVIDLRVISTTFSAEQTLTKDNVPVNVDAILFWQVEDTEKTVLNVQSYFDSMQLAAQTALRDIIGKSQLSEMLAGRDIIGKDIQDLIKERARDWGVKPIQVEIRDVKIPQELQDAMARVATSEREKDARVILAESESLAADKIIEASKKYQSDIYAMQLRALNMMYEISLNGKNLMVFIPTDSKGFSIPTPVGITGLQDIAHRMSEQNAKTVAKSKKAAKDAKDAQ
ncbi:MAG: slipin family protein [Candidatus Micrarchaeaceae archaeon]